MNYCVVPCCTGCGLIAADLYVRLADCSTSVGAVPRIVCCVDSILTMLTAVQLVQDDQLNDLGFMMAIAALLPSWPYAFHDASKGNWSRFLVSLMGGNYLLKYTGTGQSPELRLFSAVLGAVPSMAVVMAGGVRGRDVLITNGEQNALAEWSLLGVAVMSGLAIAFATGDCLDATKPEAVGNQQLSSFLSSASGVVATIDRVIHGFVARMYNAVVSAIDAVTLTTVAGCVAGHCKAPVAWAWFLALWLIGGLIPALEAPPPMPTLRPPIPTRGCGLVWHRLFTSVLMALSPPLLYMPLLLPIQRKVWAVAALLRAAILVTSILILYKQVYDHEAGEVTGFIVFCICLSSLHTAAAAGGIICYLRPKNRSQSSMALRQRVMSHGDALLKC
eukprot:TRINITY_DN10730_c0_g1_i1.p1 TRINITY_DN10730_c0_g1~~TRINITY_DN10730_c0_g1_i1.p1  ORF type:complete len:389 (+),score=44.77 TRINITY_DN10730_c0_g1_i1:175-1341(+)